MGRVNNLDSGLLKPNSKFRGVDEMDMLGIYFQMWARILQIWWPVFLLMTVGLVVLARLERKEGNHATSKGGREK